MVVCVYALKILPWETELCGFSFFTSKVLLGITLLRVIPTLACQLTFLAFYLPFYLIFDMAFHLSVSWHAFWYFGWHSIWHPIWHSILCSIWDPILHSILHSIWHSTRHSIWHLSWHLFWDFVVRRSFSSILFEDLSCILSDTWLYLTIYLTLAILQGVAHWHSDA